MPVEDLPTVILIGIDQYNCFEETSLLNMHSLAYRF